MVRKALFVISCVALFGAGLLAPACSASHYNKRYHNQQKDKYEHLQDSVPANLDSLKHHHWLNNFNISGGPGSQTHFNRTPHERTPLISILPLYYIWRHWLLPPGTHFCYQADVFQFVVTIPGQLHPDGRHFYFCDGKSFQVRWPLSQFHDVDCFQTYLHDDRDLLHPRSTGRTVWQ